MVWCIRHMKMTRFDSHHKTHLSGKGIRCNVLRLECVFDALFIVLFSKQGFGKLFLKVCAASFLIQAIF